MISNNKIILNIKHEKTNESIMFLEHINSVEFNWFITPTLIIIGWPDNLTSQSWILPVI